MMLTRRLFIGDLASLGLPCMHMRPGTLEFRKCVGDIEQLIFPGYFPCWRCGRPNALTVMHITPYRDLALAPDASGISGYGVFVLCEECWRELRPKDRVPFYRASNDKNIADISAAHELSKEQITSEVRRLRANWPLIEKAVLEGK